MKPTTFPSVFVSHGAPTLALGDSPAKRFLQTLGAQLGRPEAIVVASAHWETERPAVSVQATNATIHDFSGFPPELYQVRYPAPGAEGLSNQVAGLLAGARLPAALDARRGLDHGAWVPLSLMYPDADVPVVAVSIQPRRDPAHHLALGRALAPLRDEGVLVLGSGSFTHNLRELRRWDEDAEEEAWTAAFADWMGSALAEGRWDDLADYRTRAPDAVRNHPTDEHLLPLYVAAGAGGEGATVERLHASSTYGALRMDAFRFG